MPKLVSKSLDGTVTVTELSEQERDKYLGDRTSVGLISVPVSEKSIPENGSNRPDTGVDTNYTGYTQPGSSNWEHDDTGNQSNASGSADLVLNPLGDQRGWEPGYDY